MAKLVVKKEYEDEFENEVSKLFYIFNDNYKYTSEDIDYLMLISDCSEIYNEINNKFEYYPIVRIENEKEIEKESAPTGDVRGLLQYFIKINFKEYKDDIENGKDPVEIANKIIDKYNKRTNKR